MKSMNYIKTLCAAALFSLLTTQCAAQSPNLIPDTLSTGQKIDFKSIAEQIPNPCPEEELSEYENLKTLLEAGKTCHDAYILSSDIVFYLTHDVTAPKTENLIRAEATQLSHPHNFNTTDRPRLGQPSAPVEVVVFSDFQCPFCARAAQTLHKLHEARPDSVSIVFKHLPLQSIHPYAAASALIAAYAHSQGKFWEIHDKLFESQKDIGPDFLTEVVHDMGMEPSEIFDPAKGQALGVTIVEDLKDADSAEVAGTPSFFVNGVEVQGGSNLERMIARVDAEVNAPAQSSTEARKKARDRAVQTCPYPGLEEHYALLSSAKRVDLSMLANASLCPCPASKQTLHECASQQSCKQATELLDHIMTRLHEDAPTETLLKEIETFVRNERIQSEQLE